MKTKNNHNRWQNLFYMCVAVANGNFSYRIKRTRSNDELEAMVALHNMASQELQEIFKHHGFVNPRRTYMYLSKMDFFLNEDLSILNFSQEVPDLLQISPSDLKNIPFREVLDAPSLQMWEEIKPKFQQDNFKRFSLNLNFKTGRELYVNSNCYVSSTYDKEGGIRFLVSSFTPVILDQSSNTLDPALSLSTGQEEYRTPKIFSKKSDLRKVHQVRDYLLQNLSEDSLDMKDLARTFFTNESKLKNDFKAVFELTPFQYLKMERLKLARELVENTDLPLKTIAYTCGYPNYPHFSYAFKEEFDLSPKHLRNSL